MCIVETDKGIVDEKLTYLLNSGAYYKRELRPYVAALKDFNLIGYFEYCDICDLIDKMKEPS